MSKDKKVFILGKEVSKTQFDIYGIYDTFDKAEKEIKLDYYGGSIPRDDSEYKSKFKVKLKQDGSVDFILDKNILYSIREVPLNRSSYYNQNIIVENSNIELKKQKAIPVKQSKQVNNNDKEVKKKMTCLDKTIKEASLFLNKLKKDYKELSKVR